MEEIQIKEGTFYQTTLAKVHTLILIDKGKWTSAAIRWAHRNHCHVFVAPAHADITAFGRIISFLHSQGIRKIGLLELGERSHIALAVAARHFPIRPFPHEMKRRLWRLPWPSFCAHLSISTGGPISGRLLTGTATSGASFVSR